ncbi:MAG TPA: SCO family protein [Blastocatellia bacterium]|nr:SCO family protein [Blastocatellia bacterium]
MKNCAWGIREEMAKATGIRAGRPFAPVVACRLLLVMLCLSSSAVAGHAAQARERALPGRVAYVCVMDPDVRSAKPGKCPKCGMMLRKAGGEMPVKTAVAANQMTGDGDNADVPAQIPDTPVYDQDGRRLRFYSDLVRGKTVAINFIFTTCTTICPPLTATFRKIQQELGDRVGSDVQLISVSVDPTTDIPERLKAYSDKFHAGPGWTFVTGDRQQITRLLKALGANTGDKNDHSPMVLVGNDRAAYWTRTYGLAPADTLVRIVTAAAAKTAAASPASVGVRKARTPAEVAAAYFPNTELLTQDNKAVRFFDDLLKGKVVVINFMFTTCTSVCPPMMANLAKVQAYLGERVGNGINMISISVDPTVDTPAALKKYAEQFHAKPGWYLLTGKKEDVDTILRKVGGFAADKNDHSTLLMIGNVETGQWLKAFAMSKPAEIADAIIKLAESN